MIRIRVEASTEIEARTWAAAHGLDALLGKWYASRDGHGGRLYVVDITLGQPSFPTARS
jgi:hypothetical protein